MEFENEYTRPPSQYDTVLSPMDEQRFRLWAKTYSSPDVNLLDTSNYDMRGYFKEHGDAPHTIGDHFNDTYKKPNHITFSNESKYHTEDMPGGQWDEYAQNKDVFIPAPHQVDTAKKRNELRQYFEKYEPNSNLAINYQQGN